MVSVTDGAAGERADLCPSGETIVRSRCLCDVAGLGERIAYRGTHRAWLGFASMGLRWRRQRILVVMTEGWDVEPWALEVLHAARPARIEGEVTRSRGHHGFARRLMGCEGLKGLTIDASREDVREHGEA